MPRFRIQLEGRTKTGKPMKVSLELPCANVHEARKEAWSIVPAEAGEYVVTLWCQILCGWVTRKGFTAVVESKPRESQA